MTSWLDVVDNADFVGRMYGGAPSLENVEIHELTLARGGPLLTLRFDLPEFPKNAPRDWVASQYEVAQLTLMVIGVASVRLDGWSTEVRGSLSVVRHGPLDVETRFQGGALTLVVRSSHVRVSKITGHALAKSAP